MTIRRRRLSRLAVLVAVLVAGVGCMPAINHGPRVADGTSFGLVGSVTAGPRYTTGDLGDQPHLYGPMGVSVGHGWAAEEDSSFGYHLGAHVPVPGVFFAHADMFAQFPKQVTGYFDAGAGVTAGYTQIAPYMQLGRIGVDGNGWYTTQSFVMSPAYYTANRLYDWVWLASLSREWVGSDLRGRIFITGGYGERGPNCRRNCPEDAAPRFVAALGGSIDFFRRVSGDSPP